MLQIHMPPAPVGLFVERFTFFAGHHAPTHQRERLLPDGAWGRMRIPQRPTTYMRAEEAATIGSLPSLTAPFRRGVSRWPRWPSV